MRRGDCAVIGNVVSHYRVIKEIGRGGMGIVYKAEDTRIQRYVALKFLPQEAAKDPVVRDRFHREARAASALDHPNICTIYDIGEHGDQPFIVMQFLDGVTLRDRIAGEPLKIEEILDFGIQIADALDWAHSKGIVHRDVKPGNIFITSRSRAKLLDFGLARFRPVGSGTDIDSSAETVRSDLSTTGVVSGTISYMSPEQALGKELDARSDLFSLGVVLYEMATGQLPFEGNTLAATFDAILHQNPVDPAALRPNLPPELIHVIRKALDKTPDQRYQNADAFRSDLLKMRHSLNSEKPLPATVPSIQRSKKHPDHIGKYVIEEYLGGGMSDVYRAKDPVLGKTVAIKVLAAEGARDEESRSRFLREARMAANIEHPNIITVYDFGEDAGRPYMVMEFLRGEDLRAFIKADIGRSFEEKLRIALQVAKALHYVHGQKIIHRDIKPENIHISPAGVVKMMDFGIAKTEDLTITRPGFTMGTPYYMAPEQVLGKEITPLVDVYAYGILLFELFTGSRPISGENVEQIFYKILQEPLDLQPLQGAGVPESTIALIRSCTAKDPAQRPQSFHNICGTLTAAVEAVNASLPAPAPVAQGATAPSPSRRGVLIGLLSVVVMASVLIAFFYWRSQPQPAVVSTEPPKPAPLPAVLAATSGDMVLVEEGKVLLGADKEEGQLPAFYIDRTEVSNEAYGRFAKETNRPLPAGFDSAPPDFPVVNITIDDARQFARWAGKRLPTLKEWQKAARGVDGREYPWGNAANASLANVGGQALVSVSAFAQGESPWGARQMIGNVWEFVDELSTPSSSAIQNFRNLLTPPPTTDESWYLMMGGSYEEPLLPGATHDSAYVPARFRSPRIGFRCVKDPG